MRPRWGCSLAVILILSVILSVIEASAPGTSGYKMPGGWSINGDQEILADPMRPIVYWAHPLGSTLSFLDALTGTEISSIAVGQRPMSVGLSSDGSRLYVAVSGENQTTVVDVASRTVVRTISLPFSPLSVRAGRPGRLYVSGAQDGRVRIVNETTGAVIDQVTPLGDTFQALLEISPNKTVLLAHLLSNPVKIYKYDIASDNLVFLVVDNHDLGENFRQMEVDWGAGVAYLVSGTPYGIEMVSLANLTRLGWLPMWAYPAGVALMAQRGLVFGINRYFYGADLWVFDTTTRAQLNVVPIDPSPPGYAPEVSLLVASESAGTVLLWTEEHLRVLTLDPSISPGSPAPSSEVAGYPGFFVTANIWRGLIEPPSNTTSISVDGKTLMSVYDAAFSLVRAPSPVLPVGLHEVMAKIAWPGGSKSVAWNFRVTSPPPVARMFVQTLAPFRPGQLIEFDGIASAAALGTVIAFDWNFGDGAKSSGVHANHTFSAPGTYQVTLTVTTDLNVSGSQVRSILVEAAPAPSPGPPVVLALVLWIADSLTASTAFVLIGKRRRRGRVPPEVMRPPPAPQQNPPLFAPPAWPKQMSQRSRTLIGIAVIVCVVGGGIGTVAWIQWWTEYKSASLAIALENRYLGYTVPYNITVDGSEVSSGTIRPLQLVFANVTFSWSMNNCQSHRVIGSSWGHFGSSSTDFETKVVCSGEYASIRLII